MFANLTFRNLTPHEIVVRCPDGTEVNFPPSGTVARVATVEEVVGDVCGVPVIRRTFGAVEGLPEDGTPCLVSALVASACPGRAGVYAPDTGATAVRGENGQVRAVTRIVAA